MLFSYANAWPIDIFQGLWSVGAAGWWNVTFEKKCSLYVLLFCCTWVGFGVGCVEDFWKTLFTLHTAVTLHGGWVGAVFALRGAVWLLYMVGAGLWVYRLLTLINEKCSTLFSSTISQKMVCGAKGVKTIFFVH